MVAWSSSRSPWTNLLFFLVATSVIIASSEASPAAWESFRNLTGCHLGDHVDGITNLKQYLRRFGYISGAELNFSDSFDEGLEHAIKTYQNNFHIKPSGVLDQDTIAQIVRPRCGVPDVINSTAGSGFGKGAKIRTVGRYTHFPGRPTWENKQNLTYGFLPSLASITNDAALEKVFADAFARWSAVTALTFRRADSYQSADIRIGFFSGSHGDDEPFDGRMGTLAHAFAPPTGHLHLDADEAWSLQSSTVGPMEFDLESVVVHEIGHLLGLGHSSVEDAIMYPSISPGARRVELGDDDILGIQRLYGSNSDRSSSSPLSVESEGESTSTASLTVSSSRRAVGFFLILLGTLFVIPQ